MVTTASAVSPLKCTGTIGSEIETQKSLFDPHALDSKLLQNMAYDALVWSSLHGLLVGNRASQESGRVPGVGLIHAPISLLPMPFSESHWKQACEVAPIFNELIDRVSLDAEFLQQSLSRTKKVDAFTSRLLYIHAKMLVMNKKEELVMSIQTTSWCSSGEDSTKQCCCSVILVVVQAEERNMYDQLWLSTVLKERYQVKSIRKTLTKIDAEGELAMHQPIILQSLFLENEDDIAEVRKCFAGLWSLDDVNIVKDAIERPGLYVMKPQREGGGNNIYGDDVRLALQRMAMESKEEDAAYIVMQRIFPNISPAILMRQGISDKELVFELGIYGTYLRNKTKVIMNNQSGFLMRTKVCFSNEGGVAAGFAVLDGIYLV